MRNILASAITAIFVNKMRSFLTTLGVIIGVGSVVLLTSIGTGLTAFVNEQFEQLGSNTIFVSPGKIFDDDGGFGNREQSVIEATKPLLKRQYLDKILRDNRDSIITGTATGVSTTEARFDKTKKRVTLYGVTPDFPQVQNAKLELGNWFNDSQDKSSAKVCILGSQIAEDLFGNVDPLNKKIRLNNQQYTVIGIREETGGGFGGPQFDNYVYLPLTTLLGNFEGTLIDSFILKSRSEKDIETAIKGTEAVLLNYLDEDQFSIFDQKQLLQTIEGIFGALTIGLGGISGISLVVGGIGIMNIMLVSVTERTREIGLRKALGATPNIILAQFLIEGALLSLIGGIIGVTIAYLGTFALQAFFPAKVTLSSVLIAFGVSGATGLIFSAAPARKAAKLSPIESLRYE